MLVAATARDVKNTGLAARRGGRGDTGPASGGGTSADQTAGPGLSAPGVLCDVASTPPDSLGHESSTRLPQAVTTKNVSGPCQMSPEEGTAGPGREALVQATGRWGVSLGEGVVTSRAPGVFLGLALAREGLVRLRASV